MAIKNIIWLALAYVSTHQFAGEIDAKKIEIINRFINRDIGRDVFHMLPSTASRFCYSVLFEVTWNARNLICFLCRMRADRCVERTHIRLATANDEIKTNTAVSCLRAIETTLCRRLTFFRFEKKISFHTFNGVANVFPFFLSLFFVVAVSTAETMFGYVQQP